MKNLEPLAIEQLLTLIPDHPGLSVMQFSDGGDALHSGIKAFCKEKQYYFQLNFIDDDLYQVAHEKYTEDGVCIVKRIKWEQRRYASMARLYHVVFVTLPLPEEKKEVFIANVIHHIKTAGHIVFFLEKNDRKNLDEWWELLEEKAFVSLSTLDISNEYEILVGKKMHGWDSYN